MFDDLDVEELRRRSGVKWGLAGPGVLPAWIADMDFPPPPAVREVLRRLADDDLGYPAWDDRPTANPVRAAFAERMRELYGWAVEPGEVRLFTELIQGLQAVLHVATRPGEPVAMHVPSYPPFLGSLADMGRPLVPVPMIEGAGGWGFDADRMAEDVARSGCRAFVLVNPQNPTGRVFSRAELEAVAEVAVRHDLLVISDEIHAELAYEPHRHIPFATLGPEVAARTVTLTSASKAFNLAGLRCSVAHLGDSRVRAVLEAQPPLMFGEIGTPGVLATVAAWRDGDDWLAEVRRTLDRNRRLIGESLPSGVGYHMPDSTYLAWLDCR